MSDKKDKKNKNKESMNSLKVNKKFWKTTGGNFLIWALIFISAITIVQLISGSTEPKKITYTDLEKYIEDQKIISAEVEGNIFVGVLKEPEITYIGNTEKEIDKVSTTLPFIDSDILKEWKASGIEFDFKNQTLGAMDYILQFSPWILIIFIWLFLMRRMQSGGGPSGIFSFAKSRAKMISPDKPKITFKDVAGCEEAKVELKEVVEFLKQPKKFVSIGAKTPRGALLLGPPGTGKTLLAKAVSGEAGVPFFTISGAEFVEMFVGVGASRVRDLFEQAKQHSPSIIFIDEIDAVGRQRGAGLGGGHDEREQTLNQILVEMDGFDTDDNVILIAATNRPDVLDKALLRPGRFDRQIVVDLPDVNGREEILKIHTRKIPLGENVDLKIIGKGTPGLAGADLENLVNEAALLAARKNNKVVNMIDFEEAKDKVMIGVERKSMILSEDEKKLTAYHEGGHALVAYKTPNADPVHKITIIPRGRALGVTAQLPNEKHGYSKNYLKGRLNILMGGRVAEKIIFDDISTGAGNDISVATDIAKQMVTEWGMSDKIGPLAFGQERQNVFLGREMSQTKNISDEKAKIIDEEVTEFILRAEETAENILNENIKDLHNIAKALLEFETISGDEMKTIIEGGKIERKEKVDKNNENNTNSETESEVKSKSMDLTEKPKSNPTLSPA
ncbi:MAG: ATP-dependent zinc metalloprotease FtsH [Candidatus Neomarinimicrobiota bacterium]|nr:ATP-dependent zinc metalloprotease FtsH [Candidatus Neomarinimicrobiota bacterium]